MKNELHTNSEIKQINIDNIDYKILNPGGNKTAIVIGNEYSKEEKKQINDSILNENSDVEQVGFIDTKENKLEMAGGEFCVNATRCAIWQYLEGKQGEIELVVSGCKNKIKGGITKEKIVYVDMQIDKKITDLIDIEGIFNLVKLDGILLAVVNEKDSKEFIRSLREDENKAKKELKEIMSKFDTEEKALGIILLEKEETETKINPIIWVKEIDTLYYETACGSGSLATAIYKKYSEGIENMGVVQPSGYTINVNLYIQNDYIEKATILGKVIQEK